MGDSQSKSEDSGILSSDQSNAGQTKADRGHNEIEAPAANTPSEEQSAQCEDELEDAASDPEPSSIRRDTFADDAGSHQFGEGLPYPLAIGAYDVIEYLDSLGGPSAIPLNDPDAALPYPPGWIWQSTSHPSVERLPDPLATPPYHLLEYLWDADDIPLNDPDEYSRDVAENPESLAYPDLWDPSEIPLNDAYADLPDHSLVDPWTFSPQFGEVHRPPRYNVVIRGSPPSSGPAARQSDQPGSRLRRAVAVAVMFVVAVMRSRSR
jgi:hypothetical protein